ncbi:hypothetical protein BDV59DRAFT_113011 [Aspergillus ambiguus]|uniref:uncharacterized protein n=1 Tax=Aspergillus ambiguus TaxID=176160 RepID=UPI003CCCF930
MDSPVRIPAECLSWTIPVTPLLLNPCVLFRGSVLRIGTAYMLVDHRGWQPDHLVSKLFLARKEGRATLLDLVRPFALVTCILRPKQLPRCNVRGSYDSHTE